jgi:hypothetical protein
MPSSRGIVCNQTLNVHSISCRFLFFCGLLCACLQYFDNFDEVFFGPWSAYRSATYGYGRMTIHNATHLHWAQLIDEGHAGTDELWIQKTPKRHAQQEEPTKRAASRQPRIALE